MSPHFLSPHFTEEEFRCKCGCGASAIDFKLLMMLEQARTASGIPYIIRSGCRCPRHNKQEGGEDDSSHLTDTNNGEFCQAVDIATPGSITRFHVIRGLLAAGFPRIGFGPEGDFVHADIDLGKAQNVFFME